MDLILKILEALVVIVVIPFLAAVIVVVVHEYTHALISSILGDRLPRFNRRLTLNPLSHIDMLGILFFVTKGLGWGKPVETSPRDYKDKAKDTIIVGLSGPAMSFILAVMALATLKIIEIQSNAGVLNLVSYQIDYLKQFFNQVYDFSFNFAVISLLPIYPYDGFMIWGKLISPKTQYKIFYFQRLILTFYLLIILMVPEAIREAITPLKIIVEFIVSIIINGIINL